MQDTGDICQREDGGRREKDAYNYVFLSPAVFAQQSGAVSGFNLAYSLLLIVICKPPVTNCRNGLSDL